MGTWGYYNFDSDSALDSLASIINSIVEEIRKAFDIQNKDGLIRYGDYLIVAKLDVLATLFDHYKFYPDIQLYEIEKWKEQYLTAFQRELSILSIADEIEFSKKRLEVIENTFDRLLMILRNIIAFYDSN